jgi:CheY-like chemotaxis protein
VRWRYELSAGRNELSATHPSAAKIVLVEDNSADVFLLRHALDQHAEEYALDVLRDGEEAIQFVNRQRSAGPHGEPCVIVLDLHLPSKTPRSSY